jgi:hypothetical protein
VSRSCVFCQLRGNWYTRLSSMIPSTVAKPLQSGQWFLNAARRPCPHLSLISWLRPTGSNGVGQEPSMINQQDPLATKPAKESLRWLGSYAKRVGHNSRLNWVASFE